MKILRNWTEFVRHYGALPVASSGMAEYIDDKVGAAAKNAAKRAGIISVHSVQAGTFDLEVIGRERSRDTTSTIQPLSRSR